MTVEITPVVKSKAPAPRYSGKAVLAFPAGLLAVFLPAPFSMLLGGIAILLAGAARRDLKRHTALCGTTLSLLGFLLGAGALAVQIAPFVIVNLLVAVSNIVPS